MNRIASFLTGFNAILLSLLFFITYRWFEIQYLFERILPMESGIRRVSSILLALVVVFLLLIFGANIDKIKLNDNDKGNWLKGLLFAFTLFINVYFWQVWDGEVSTNDYIQYASLTIVFKAVIAIFFAGFDFALNHLFIAAWQESEEVLKRSKRASRLEESVSKSEEALSELKARISQSKAKLSELIASQDPKICPKCFQEFDSVNQRNGHMRGCSSDRWKNGLISKYNLLGFSTVPFRDHRSESKICALGPGC